MIVRWLCVKCNKKWAHPLRICLHCRNEVIKQEGSKIFVDGITQVNVASPYHPIVPYQVLLLKDEYGNKIPKKSMRKYELGEPFTISKAKTKNAVSIVKIKYDIEYALREVVKLLDPFPFSKEDSVLIKVDAEEKVASQQGSTTNPQVLEAVVDLLKEEEVKDIVIVDRSKKDLSLSSKKNGIFEVCKEKNVKLINLEDEVCYEKDGVRIPKIAEGRKIIVVSPLKTASSLSPGGTIKSLISLCPLETQERLKENPAIHLPAFLSALSPSLIIGDGTVGLERDTLLKGNKPIFLHALLASKNCAALDYTFAQLGMLTSPEYIQLLAGKQEVVGEELESMKRRLT